MNNQLSLPAELAGYSQLRGWTRFPPDERETWVILGDERKGATICDEAFGGVGITIEMADSVSLKVDDPLTILNYDCPAEGRIQWIHRDSETQKIRFGVRWT